MDSLQIVVTAGGAVLIGFTLWFFFGKPATPAAKRSSKPYLCPMHPWIGSDDPTADCSLCGMKLVRSDGTR
jgi:hypothetical protein